MTYYRYRRFRFRHRRSSVPTVLAVGAAVLLLASAAPSHHHKHTAAPVRPAQPVVVAAGGNRALGAQLAASYGWTGSQFDCLNWLWTRESNWRTNAVEDTSINGQTPTYAYGIPQALPASKMAAAGADYRTNPRTQIRWGLSYIRGRYGTPCGAWAHEEANGWY